MMLLRDDTWRSNLDPDIYLSSDIYTAHERRQAFEPPCSWVLGSMSIIDGKSKEQRWLIDKGW